MAKVANAVEKLRKITTPEYSARASQTTDRRQTTDGQATAYSEREREFAFAKNYSDLLN